MFAVFKTGGKQYKASAGDLLRIEKVAGEPGDTVRFDSVLTLRDGDNLFVGRDAEGKSVEAEIVAQTRNDKVLVFKKKRRHNYRRKAGHKQDVTLVRFIGLAGTAPKKAVKKSSRKRETLEAAESLEA